ncbi:hypothetical protein ACOSOMT5_P1010 [Acidiphilium sp. MT5]
MKLFVQLIRFGVVGVANTLVGLIIIYGLMFFFDTGILISNLTGYIIGLIFGFTLHRVWTFNNSQELPTLFSKYTFVAIVCYCLNISAVLIINFYFNSNRYLDQLLGICVYSIAMFLGCRQFVFTGSQLEI